jgi:predicted phage tail protein
MTPDSAAPANVGGLNGTLEAGGKVKLTWTDPGSDLDHIEITWTPGGTTPVSVAKGIQTWTSSALSHGTAYAFTVKAVDAAGNKSTGETTGSLTPDNTAPPYVGGLNGTLEAGGKVKLTWTDPAEDDLDHIEITWTNGGTTPVSVAKGMETWTSSALSHGTAYTFTVKAVDAAGNKNAGKTVTMTPDSAAPGEVSNLSPTIDKNKVTLAWADPPESDLKEIRITWSPGNGSVSVAKGTGTKEITGLTNGTRYTFTVKAVDNAGNMSDGETASGTPAASTGPVAATFTGGPQDETITLSGAGNTISWAANTALVVSVDGTFSGYRWALDSSVLEGETTSSLTLYAGSLSVKQHSLTVYVTKEGHEYTKRVTFTVTP